MSLRVGIDGRYIQDHFPGIGRYTYNLVKELGRLEGPETFILFHNPHLPNSRFDIQGLVGPRVHLWPALVATLSLGEQVALPLLIRKAGVHLFHSPHYTLPLLAPCPLVATIHDTIPLEDPTFLPSPTARLAYRIALRLALWRSQRIIADSTAVREDLMRLGGLTPQRVRVVYPGVECSAGMPDPAGTGKQHILYVGTNKPHKNLVRLVQAYAQAGVELPLVIAGQEDRRFPQARQEAQALGQRVRFLGQVGEDALRELYRSAAAFVFPSLAEGFGLPALEAMAAGVPVIASSRPALPEIVGDATLLVNPLDVSEMAVALQRVIEDQALAQELSRRGRERASHFSWERTARGCLAVYREIGGAR